MIISFKIPILPKMSNQLLRRHWSFVMREKELWHRLVREEVLNLTAQYGLKPFDKARLQFIRASTSEPDWDGLVSGFKFITDGLVQAGVLVDDKPSVIVSAEYKWIKCKRSEQGVFVAVERVGE